MLWGSDSPGNAKRLDRSEIGQSTLILPVTVFLAYRRGEREHRLAKIDSMGSN